MESTFIIYSYLYPHTPNQNKTTDPRWQRGKDHEGLYWTLRVSMGITGLLSLKIVLGPD